MEVNWPNLELQCLNRGAGRLRQEEEEHGRRCCWSVRGGARAARRPGVAGGATARSRGRLEAVADGEGAAYEFGLLIGAEEGGRRESYDQRGRTPELQQWGGA